jgi:glycosyltransferase involved in cell wall biosynthesis
LAGARVVKHEKNRGYGAAIQSIFAEARKIDPDVLVILDADAQHSPREIPALINRFWMPVMIVSSAPVKKRRKRFLYIVASDSVSSCIL